MYNGLLWAIAIDNHNAEFQRVAAANARRARNIQGQASIKRDLQTFVPLRNSARSLTLPLNTLRIKASDILSSTQNTTIRTAATAVIQ